MRLRPNGAARGVVLRVRGTLRRGWRSAFVVAFMVAIASGAVLTLASGARRTANAPDAFTASVGGDADAIVLQPAGRPRTAAIAAVPTVRSVSAMTFMFAGFADAADIQSASGTLSFVGTRPFGSHLVAGRDTDKTKPFEFVADKSFVAQHEARLGEEFHAISWSQAQADHGQGFGPDPRGPSFTGVLVGVFDSPGSLQDNYSTTVFSPALLGHNIGIVATVIGVHLRTGATTGDLRDDLDTLPGGQALQLQSGLVVAAEVRNAVDAQAKGTWIIAIVAGVAALIALGQLLSRYTRLTEADRGSLVAIGFTKRQLMLESIVRAAVPVVSGVAVGIAIAAVASGVFPAGFVRALEPHSGIRLDATVLAAGGALLVAGLLAWVGVALLTDGSDRTQSSRVATNDVLARTAPSATAAIGARFALTSRGRSTAGTVATMGMIVAGIVGTVAFGVSLDRLVSDRGRFGSNFTFQVGDNSDLNATQLRKALTGDPDIAGLMIITGDTARAGKVTVEVAGVERVQGNLAPYVLSGRLPAGPNEVAMGRLTARQLHLHSGDQLDLVGAENRRASYRVVGLTVVPTVGGNEGVGHGVVLTAEGMQRLVPEPATAMAGVLLRSNAPLNAPARISARAGAQAGNEDTPSAIINVARVRFIPTFLAILLAALLLMVLLHTVIMSIQDRRQDLAVLTALGADRVWIGRTVHWQTTILTVMPLVFGVPLGIVAGSVVFRAFADGIGAVPDPSLPIALVAGLVAGLVFVANVVAVVPTRRARRLSTAELLRVD